MGHGQTQKMEAYGGRRQSAALPSPNAHISICLGIFSRQPSLTRPHCTKCEPLDGVGGKINVPMGSWAEQIRDGQGSARGCYLLRGGDESSADEGNRLFSFFVFSRGVGCLGEYERYWPVFIALPSKQARAGSCSAILARASLIARATRRPSRRHDFAVFKVRALTQGFFSARRVPTVWLADTHLASAPPKSWRPQRKTRFRRWTATWV